MRHAVLALLLLTPVAGFAQTQPGTTTIGPPAVRQPPSVAPAPVPSVPPAAARGEHSGVPERIAPPGLGNNGAGPADATPFSSAPSNTMTGQEHGAAPPTPEK